MIANLYWTLLNTNDMTGWRKLAAKTNLNQKHAHQKQTNKQNKNIKMLCPSNKK